MQLCVIEELFAKMSVALKNFALKLQIDDKMKNNA